MPIEATGCAELQPRLAAYALGESDQDSDLAAHLESCSHCRDELLAYAQVARVLPYAASEATPAPELRRRILAAVAPQPVERRPARPRPASRPWALGFALLALLALLTWNVALQQQVARQSAQIATSRTSWRTMTSLLNAPDLVWYALGGGGAGGHLWLSRQQRVACLVAEQLPAIAPDHVYQVWLAHGSERTNGGTFEARDGSAWIIITLDEPAVAYDAVGVTVEPRGGSPAPTGSRVLYGKLIDRP